MLKHGTAYHNTSKKAALFYCVKNTIQVGYQGVQDLWSLISKLLKCELRRKLTAKSFMTLLNHYTK